MTSDDIFVLREKDKLISDFLLKARDAGQLRVRIGEEVFAVKVTQATVSEKGRKLLSKGFRDAP